MFKILIAEDDRISAKILERNIKNWGYQVVMVDDGEKAWEILEKENIQIAILDWMMPKLDGIELCKKIRENKTENYIYITLLTARMTTEDVVQGLNAGADDYITKPVNPLELKARLNTGRRIIQLENDSRELQEKLELLSKQDSLTGLWNKRTITELLEEELSRGFRDEKPISTILIDIDKFKGINDTYGHPVGDEVLLAITSRLKKQIRKYDHIGRYGGDEIMIVLWNVGYSTLVKLISRFRQCIWDQEINTDAGPLRLSISIGGTSTESHQNVSPLKLIKTSDKALYSAKHKGRNRAEVIKLSKPKRGKK